MNTTNPIVVIDMAIGALPWGCRVRSSQREPGAVVVERRILPGTRVVARAASLREVRTHVVWVRRTLVILQVTRNASRVVQIVVVVHVAIGALPRRHGVHAGQWKSRQRMIERGIRP